MPAADRHLIDRPARHPAIRRAVAELRRFGVPTEVEWRWSDDGSGVTTDAPRCIHLHRTLVVGDRLPPAVLALSTRVVALDLLTVARHELGHALVFLDGRVTATARFQALFGDAGKRYRVGRAIDEIERRLHRHGGLANPRYRRVVSIYAATHPHEAFAEAVRIALATAGDDDAIDAWVAAHGVRPVVGDQIRFAANWLRRYRRR